MISLWPLISMHGPRQDEQAALGKQEGCRSRGREGRRQAREGGRRKRTPCTTAPGGHKGKREEAGAAEAPGQRGLGPADMAWAMLVRGKMGESGAPGLGSSHRDCGDTTHSMVHKCRARPGSKCRQTALSFSTHSTGSQVCNTGHKPASGEDRTQATLVSDGLNRTEGSCSEPSRTFSL